MGVGEDDQITTALAELAAACPALTCLVTTPDGEILSEVGDVAVLDSSSLVSLAVREVGSKDGLANLIGEEEFSLLFNAGGRYNVHVCLLKAGFALVIVFDDRSALGAVRASARDFRSRLKSLLPLPESTCPGPGGPSSKSSDSGTPAVKGR